LFHAANISNISETCKVFEENAIVLARGMVKKWIMDNG
jgi:hypothetical protein